MKNYPPYPGLRPYREDEKDNFYGREQECDILIDKLLANRLTLLFAASGVGKSSLLNAAVIPELKSPTGKNLPVIYYNDWVANPLHTLRLAIIESLHITDVALPETTNNSLAELLRFYSIFCRHPLVLILDQFEEFFRYHQNRETFKPFIRQLTDIILDRDLPVSVCISMREDFALELNAFKPELPTLLFENFYRLEKLSEKATEQAILEPIKNADYLFAPGLLEELKHDLLGRELDRNPNQPVSDNRIKTAEPPYLQIVCSQLWELDQHDPEKTIRKETYTTAGKAQGLLKNYIQQELKKFTPAEKQIASKAFDHLVSQRGTKMAYTAAVLAKSLRIDPDRLHRVLEELSKRRILRSQNREDHIWYELYHDMFSESLERWNTRWKNKMRTRRTVIGLVGSATVAIMLYAGYDFWNNATNYHLRLKNTPNDRLEIYQGKLGSADWALQQHYVAESRFQRKQLEPDKCVKACDILAYQDLNNELIADLPLMERITAYAKNGQIGQFDMQRRHLNKTAFALIDETLKYKNREKSIAALNRLGSMQVNAVISKMIYEWQENTSNRLRDSVTGSLPLVATATLLQEKPFREGRKAGNHNIAEYLRLQRDWVENEKDWQLHIHLTILNLNNYKLYRKENRSVFQVFISMKGYKAIPLLIKALETNNTDVRRSAAQALAQLKATEAIEPLIKALEDNNTDVRSSAAQALAQLKATEAIEPLIKALEDNKAGVRSFAALALGQLKGTEAVAPLIKALKDEDSYVRSSAAQALAHLKATEAIVPLIKALEDDNPMVIRSAAQALAHLKATEAIAPLIKALAHNNYSVRSSAVQTLAQLKVTDTIAPLIKALEGDNQGVSHSAAQVLTQLKVTDTIAPLIKALESENYYVRSSASQALAQLKATEAVAPLIKALKDDHYYVRSSAAQALAQLKATEAVAPLIKVLKDDHYYVRSSAAQALAELKATEAVAPLIKALKDDHYYVRSSTAQALAQLKATEAVAPLIKALEDDDSDVRNSAAQALAKLKAIEAIAPLIKALASDNYFVHSLAAQALAKLKAIEAIEPLIKALADDVNYVRYSAAQILGRIKAREAIMPLIKALEDDDSDVRRFAAKALAQLKATEAIMPLIKALKDNDSDVRGYAAKALSFLKAEEAIEPLIKVLEDDDIHVRNYAAQALGKLGSIKTLERLIGNIYSEESIIFRQGITNIALKHNLHSIANWMKKIDSQNQNNDKKLIETQDKINLTKKPQQWLEQLNNTDISWFKRSQALGKLAKSNTPEIARQSVIDLLQSSNNKPLFDNGFYQYLVDQHATEAVNAIQQQLTELDKQWKTWRKQRDNLSDHATEKQREAVHNIKPLYSAYTYAEAIARLNPQQGIKLLDHNLYEARRGAWEGLARLADVDLVFQLDKQRADSQNPIFQYAAYRAIDLSLIHIDANARKQDRDALDTYLQQGVRDKQGVAPRIEWTRDRIDETLASIKRVKNRIAHWFDKK